MFVWVWRKGRPWVSVKRLVSEFQLPTNLFRDHLYKLTVLPADSKASLSFLACSSALTEKKTDLESCEDRVNYGPALLSKYDSVQEEG